MDKTMKHRVLSAAAGILAAATVSASSGEAFAQEIQLTGPLAGQPAVRRLRLHRQDRFDVAFAPTFTILDEFRRHILFGGRANYHFFDWLGVGVFGAGGINFNTALSDELQEKAVNNRNCLANPNALACKRTAVSLCRGSDCVGDTQLGRIVWMVAPQVTVVPFRGKFSFFGKLFLDADISLFAGFAVVGIDERKDCTLGKCVDPPGVAAGSDKSAFSLEHRIAPTGTFGLGFNFYPNDFLAFGAEFRGTPFEWNTSGFDNGGEDSNAPDNVIDSNDRAFHFNPMLSVYFSVQLPTKIKISD